MEEIRYSTAKWMNPLSLSLSLKNSALPWMFIATPAVYPRLVVELDFIYIIIKSENQKCKRTFFIRKDHNI